MIPAKACPVLRFRGRNPEEWEEASPPPILRSWIPMTHYVTLAKARARIHLSRISLGSSEY